MKKALFISVMVVLAMLTACNKEVTITVESNNDSWGKVSGGGTYAKGTEVSLKATPMMSIYKFSKWEDGNRENPRMVTAKKNATYKAIFEKNTSGGGSAINTGIACIDSLIRDMIWVAGGLFRMGASDDDTDALDVEKPQHRVTLSSFYILKYEVTQELWNAVFGSDTYVSGKWTAAHGLGDNYPAYYLSQANAQDFINKLNDMTGLQFRLPTEAEWEYAARGGNLSQGYLYAGNNDIDSVAWYSKDAGNYTAHPIMQKRPNELGLYDMTGNVREYVSDYLSATYYSESDGTTNPQGPKRSATSGYVVVRGGGFYSRARDCRNTSRVGVLPTATNEEYGFRLGLSDLQ